MQPSPTPPARQALIDRQAAMESVFLAFAHRDYIRHMDYCTCLGSGCVLCSGRGWRHTPQSMAFGHGLNASAVSLNPYSVRTDYELHTAFHYGKGARARAEVARIRHQLDLFGGAVDL